MDKYFILLLLILARVTYQEDCLSTNDDSLRKINCNSCDPEDPMKCGECANTYHKRDDGFCIGDWEICRLEDKNCKKCDDNNKEICGECIDGSAPKDGKCSESSGKTDDDDKSEGNEDPDCAEYEAEECPKDRCQVNDEGKCVELKRNDACWVGPDAKTNCIKCSDEDPEKCGICGDTWDLTEDGYCTKPGMACVSGKDRVDHCQKCDEENEKECSECQHNFELNEEKKCVRPKDKLCLDIENCERCDKKDGNLCDKCFHPYFDLNKEENICVLKEEYKCRATVPFCKKCKGEDACEKCEKGMEVSEETGQCEFKPGFECLANDENCESCDHWNTQMCRKCAPNYMMLFGRCLAMPGFACLIGEGRINHCAMCNFEDEYQCAVCDYNYELIDGECVPEEGSECVTGDDPIPNCMFCDEDDGNKCGTCYPFFDLNEEGTCDALFGAACLIGDEAIENCERCEPGNENQCGKCKKHYELIDGACQPEVGSECITGADATENCDQCDTDDTTRCAKCLRNYDLDENRKCVKKEKDACLKGDAPIEHCNRCSKEDASLCGKCENKYYIADDGTCHLCSDDISDLCEKCNSSSECKKCVKGYIAIGGKCFPDTPENRALIPIRKNPGLTFGLMFMKPIKNGRMTFFAVRFFRWFFGLIKLIIEGTEYPMERNEQEIQLDMEAEQKEEADIEEGSENEDDQPKQGEVEDQIRRLLLKGLRNLEKLNSKVLPSEGENSVDMQIDGEVTTLQSVFNGADALTSFENKDQNAGSIQSTKNMFKGCKTLTDADLSSLAIDNLNEANGMFSGCEAVETLNLEGINFGEEVDFNDLLKDMKNLKELSLGESSAALLAKQLGGEEFEGAIAFEMIDGKLVPKACNSYYWFAKEEHRCHKCSGSIDKCSECVSEKICVKCEEPLISLGTKCVSESELLEDVKLEFIGKFNLFDKQAIFARNDLQQQAIKNGNILNKDDPKLYQIVSNKPENDETENPEATRLRKLALRNVQTSDLSEIRIQFKETPENLASYFEGIETLEEITVTKAEDTGRVQNLVNMFALSNVKQADLSLLTIDSIEEIKGMFTGIKGGDYFDISGIKVKPNTLSIRDVFLNAEFRKIKVASNSGFTDVDDNCSILDKDLKCESCQGDYELVKDVCKPVDDGNDYKTAFIVFLILFIICFVGSGVIGYFMFRKKTEIDYGEVRATTQEF